MVTPAGLEGGYWALRRALEVIENNVIPVVTVLGELQLGKRGLYPNISTKGSASATRALMNLLSYCDGKRTLLDIADLIDQPMWDLVLLLEQLQEHDLVRVRTES